MNARIVDAGPLLFLARLERFSLLCLDVDQVLVPSAVLQEIRQKPDPVLNFIETNLENWLRECPLTNMRILEQLPILGKGEREVIAQAIEQRIISVVLDDMNARRVARGLGLQPIGTVGLLLAAKKRGLLPSLKAELQRLIALGFWISQSLWEEAIQEAHEREEQ